MGERYNNGKPMLSLIPAYATEEVAKVLTYGATKYSKNNWLKGRPWMEFVDSLERHLQAWKRGEDIDEESGCLHAAHLACNALMLVELIKIRPDLDDRPKEFYTQIENTPQITESISSGNKDVKLFTAFKTIDGRITLDSDRFEQGDTLLIEEPYGSPANSIGCEIEITKKLRTEYGGTDYDFIVADEWGIQDYTWISGTIVKELI